MKDYNTITAELLKKSPKGIDCYVSNVSYEDALQDIHCTGDAVRRMLYWGRACTGEHMMWDKNDRAWKYVIPVHLVVREIFDGCVNLIEDTPDELTPRDKLLCSFLCKIG